MAIIRPMASSMAIIAITKKLRDQCAATQLMERSALVKNAIENVAKSIRMKVMLCLI